MIGGIKGDIRSLDYSSYVLGFRIYGAKLCTMSNLYKSTVPTVSHYKVSR